jgi:methanogenic corrinoid protein MtbC1
VTIRQRSDAEGPWLSIGALSRATGIAVETLRTWESRYGFPRPERKPSRHRVYRVSDAPRLRRIAHALALGHRAGQVVGASDEELARLLEASGASSLPAAGGAGAVLPAGDDLPTLLRLVRAFDGPRLTRLFLSDWARLGPVEFLEGRAAPLVRAVGEAWQAGDLEIRHERFLSERVGDLLRALRLPFEERASGPLVVLATLPGEAHGIGLQMAALVAAAAGCRTLSLGSQVPIPQIASLARDLGARAAAISVSRSSRGAATAAALRRLREALPRRVLLVVGGEGAPASRAGFESLPTLRGLDAWARRLVSGLAAATAAP